MFAQAFGCFFKGDVKDAFSCFCCFVEGLEAKEGFSASGSTDDKDAASAGYSLVEEFVNARNSGADIFFSRDGYGLFCFRDFLLDACLEFLEVNNRFFVRSSFFHVCSVSIGPI